MPRKPASSFMLDAAKLTTPKLLETAIGLARDEENAGVRAMLEIRARQLNREDLIPPSWSSPTPPTRPATPPVLPAQTTMLDQAPGALMESHEDLDRVVRALAREQGVDYHVALDSFMAETTRAREFMAASPPTVRDVLSRCGVKRPDSFEGDVRTLELRDGQVVKTLEQGEARLATQRLDSQGRVQLGRDFDISSYLRDPERRERDWRKARELNAEYVDRDRWDADLIMCLEGGVDLCATLERGPALQEAHQRAREVGDTMDGIIEAGREPAAKLRELDTAISALNTERNAIAPKAPGSQPAKTLDRPEGPIRFVDLTAEQMGRALSAYDHGRPGLSLDDAAAQVAGGVPRARTAQDADLGPGSRTPGISDFTTGREELHEAVVKYQREHRGCDYLTALQIITKAGPVLWQGAANPSGR